MDCWLEKHHFHIRIFCIQDHPFFLSLGSSPLSESQCVDLVDLLWKVNLLLLMDDAKARSAHKTVNYFQVTADTAVHLIRDHALIRHIVLDHNDAVGPQGFLAASQELHQVVVCQVAWGEKRKCSMWKIGGFELYSFSMEHRLRGFAILQAALIAAAATLWLCLMILRLINRGVMVCVFVPNHSAPH